MKEMLKTYVVGADLKITANIKIEAHNLEEAILKSKDLKVTDFEVLQLGTPIHVTDECKLNKW